MESQTCACVCVCVSCDQLGGVWGGRSPPHEKESKSLTETMQTPEPARHRDLARPLGHPLERELSYRSAQTPKDH